MADDARVKVLRRKFEAANQGHLFEGFDSMTAAEKQEFLGDLESVPLDELAGLFEMARKRGG